MSIGAFTDKTYQPTQAEINQALGPKLADWQSLIRFIREQYPSDEDFKFLYGKRYGWALRFRIRDSLLTSLYPTAGSFTAQINLGSEAVEQTRRMALGDHVREVIDRATPYPEGRWLFIPVHSAADIDDIKQLLALRAATKKLYRKTPG